MLFDVYPFLPFLNEEQRQSLVKKVEDEENGRSRAKVGLWKVKKVNGLLNTDKVEDTIEFVKQIHEDYLKISEEDGKPEKGERKIADDLVLVINELLQQH